MKSVIEIGQCCDLDSDIFGSRPNSANCSISVGCVLALKEAGRRFVCE